MKSLYQYYLLFAILFFSNRLQSQYITVDYTTYTPQQLVKDKFIGTKNLSCVSISNVTVSGGNFGGSDASYGYFTKGSSTFPMDEGIILSTGKVSAGPGPKGPVQSATLSDWVGDPDLADASGYPMSDLANATILEFDFTSMASNKISFRYMFLSEEYRPDNCRYSDAFAFLIKKADNSEPYKNIALVPGTNIPVTCTTISGAYKNGCTPQNSQYFEGFEGYDNPATSATNFNGQTKILTAIADVEPGKLYHIKLVIADEGYNANSQYDSAVFLEAGSFTGNKNLGPDLSMENGTALCTSGSYEIDATPNPFLEGTSKMFTWYKDGVQVASGNIPKYIVLYQDPGLYEVEINLDSGCRLKGRLKVEQQILPVIGTTVFNGVCDDDLDGNAEAILNLYTQQIISNLSQDYRFDIKYFDKIPSNINNPTESPINKLEFSSPSKDAYIWIKPGSCSPILAKITFIRNTLSSFDNNVSIVPFDICDDKLENKKTIDISSPDYMNVLIPMGYEAKLDFYKSRKAANNKDSKEYLLDTNITLDNKNPKQNYFVRFHQSGLCDNVAEVQFSFKQPKRSAILKDTIICKNSKIDVEVEPTFDFYEWSSGEKGNTINKVKDLKAGDYWVKLTSNGCVYQQFFKISEPQDLIINNVLIDGDKVTVFAANGIPPYQYSLDGAPYQPNNTYSVSKGNHTISVKDACGFVTQNFSIIGLKNVITPNNDGVNDFIDYSDLTLKIDPKFEVFDRSGLQIFRGDAANQFIWNGKQNGRALPTSSYWYILEWNEIGNPKRQQYTGWILLKNRN